MFIPFKAWTLVEIIELLDLSIKKEQIFSLLVVKYFKNYF